MRIVPRLPQCIARIEARRWPLLTERGVVRADLTIERGPTGGITFTCVTEDGAVIPKLVIRHRQDGANLTETFTHVTRLTASLGPA